MLWFFERSSGFFTSTNRRNLYIFIALVCLYLIVNLAVRISVKGYLSITQTKCYNSKEDSDTLIYMIQKSQEILSKHEIDPFLCYGSLFGALRINNPLPWDYDFDIGILYDEFNRVDFSELKREFNNVGMDIVYQPYSGNFKLIKGKMTGDIMIFVEVNNMAERVGIESWIFYIHYKLYHRFPKRLIQRPLPKTKFAGTDWSVPREGIEMQKYLYPNNWKEIDGPAGCKLPPSAKKKIR